MTRPSTVPSDQSTQSTPSAASSPISLRPNTTRHRFAPDAAFGGSAPAPTVSSATGGAPKNWATTGSAAQAAGAAGTAG
ncbi:hypothetical protein ACFV2U_24435 [Streptomyces sp. NPDC059697]|uniref:hypothetical protein n=1 Tax=Streptomyces sp. NPDC059697 TaxID=3346912 RepID=UPI0036C8D737